jgi:hypothetical protein
VLVTHVFGWTRVLTAAIIPVASKSKEGDVDLIVRQGKTRLAKFRLTQELLIKASV